MAEPTNTETERVQTVIDALDALERLHGTRSLALALEQIEYVDNDPTGYAERRWAAMPEMRERIERYARMIDEARGGESTYEPKPVTAEPLLPAGPDCRKLDRRGRTCVWSLANGWITQSDLCGPCTGRFMAALDTLGEPLDWHEAYVERATA